MNRKTIKILIGFLVLVIISWQFGFFTRFNYLTGKIDSIRDKPRIVTVGESIENYGVPIINLNERYGFYEHIYGCIVTSSELRGINCYNSVIEKFLNKKNGKDWQKKYQTELDSLIKNNLTE